MVSRKKLIPFSLAIAVLLAAALGGWSLVESGYFRATEDSEAALARIQAQRLIIDDHEHIQSLEQLPAVLGAMDALGIGRMVLLGSSWFTITLNPRVGFSRYDWNNEQIMQICEQHPGRFEAWPTINPEDPKKLEKFKDYHQRGAVGLKLYLGHGYVIPRENRYMFHTMAIDDPSMFPLYEYCQEQFVPVCIHVNPGPKAPGFAEEFLAMLRRFPDLKVICPHFMLSSIRDSRLREFLDTFPNLYSDISFGFDSFFQAGMKRISKDPDKFRSIFGNYPNRFMFATDMVVTAIDFKNQQWIQERFQAYLDMLTKKTYTTPHIVDKETGNPVVLRGLALPPRLLERVLYKNYEDFLALRPRDTRITREIVWSRMGIRRANRKPGQMLSPNAWQTK